MVNTADPYSSFILPLSVQANEELMEIQNLLQTVQLQYQVPEFQTLEFSLGKHFICKVI
jgi:hypothetical protein